MDRDDMSTTDGAETLEYRTELDRLYQLSRRRAASRVPEGTSSGGRVPSEEAIAEQKRQTDKLVRDALASEGDVYRLCASVVHETTRGYVEEFLAQSSIDRDDIVCVRGATDETHRMVLSELLSTLGSDPVTVPVSAAVGTAGASTLRSNGAVDPSPDGRRDAHSTPKKGVVDPAETAARIIAVLVDTDLETRHPIVDLSDVARSEPPAQRGRVVELVLSGMDDAGIGGVVRLPDVDALGADGLDHGVPATYTIDLRETDAGTEARMIGADSGSLSGDWWLLRKA